MIYRFKIDNLRNPKDKQAIEQVECSYLFENGVKGYGFTQFASLTDANHFLTDNGELTFIVTLMSPKPNAYEQESIIPSKPFNDYIDSTEFSDISFRIFEHEEDSDSVISEKANDNDSVMSEEEGNVETSNIIHAHKVILAAASPWFKMLFTNGMKESSKEVINLYEVPFDVFKRLIRYCYTYELEVKDLNDAYEVLRVADRFQLTKTYKGIFNTIRQEINIENVWEVWDCAAKYYNQKTVNTCIVYISSHMKSVIESSAILKAKAKNIKVAFNTEYDEHNIKEVELYETAIKWVKEQIKEKDKEVEVKKEDKDKNEEDKDKDKDEEYIDNIKQIENDLAQILESVRFTLISPDYLYHHVETNSFIMSIDSVQKKLFEGYRYHAMLPTKTKLEHVARIPI
ncbi:MAG: hypothetical protein EXX96DRAFT_618792 [Benjaminiella poitrasii]|nr:MAG: hypothetical protein EXX96DRAFT_618792 [Benjaminiella poitrasii]